MKLRMVRPLNAPERILPEGVVLHVGRTIDAETANRLLAEGFAVEERDEYAAVVQLETATVRGSKRRGVR